MGSRKRGRKRSAAETPSNINDEETKTKSCSASMSELPSSVVLNILSRLSIKTLYRCVFVCREWREFILDPYFTTLRRSAGAAIDVLIFTNGNFRLLDLESSTHQSKNSTVIIPRKRLDLLGSCNGFLCLSDYHHRDVLYVTNPILGEYVALPRPKSPKPQNQKQTIISSYGFGFSPVTGHCKVLRIMRETVVGKPTKLSDFAKSDAEVFTLGTETWRSVGKAPYPRSGRLCSATLNGTLHWVVDGVTTCIYSFDMGDELVRTIQMPPWFGDIHYFMRLGVLGGCLCIFDNLRGSYLDMWLMKDYGIAGSWVKDRILKTSIPPGLQGPALDPITIWKDGEILMSIRHGPLVSYKPEERRFAILEVDGVKEGFRTVSLSSSFVSLKDVAVPDFSAKYKVEYFQKHNKKLLPVKDSKKAE